jgi:hypothetical protein
VPYAIKPAGKGLFKVVNTVTGKVHAKGTTKAKAQRQVNRLYAADEAGSKFKRAK